MPVLGDGTGVRLGFVSCPVCGARHVPTLGTLGEGAYASRCEACGHMFKFRSVAPLKSTITFTVNGKQYTVGNEYSATTTLNEFLRQSGASVGTKYMCREGGCGCCTVTASLYNPLTQKDESSSVNSCLCPLYVCDGWSITTVEGIGSQRAGLHPIQQQLADHNGSQCGFCSPGFVMNMYSLLQNTPKPPIKVIEDSFDGNICRCTGYRSILDAMKSFAAGNKSVPCTDIEDISKRWCKRSGRSCDDRNKEVSLHIVSADAQWYRPASLAELYDLLEQHKTEMVRLTFGNTASGVVSDLGPWNYQVLVDMHEVKELFTASISTTVTLGANLSVANLVQFFFSNSSATGFAYLSTLGSHLSKVAQLPVRNVGCWAGNLMIKHKYPAFPSDVFLVFETVGAKITIGQTQEVLSPLQFLSTDMTGRVIEQVNLPSLTDDTFVRTYRVTPRAQNCRAYVNAGILMRLDKATNYTIMDQPSIVYGGISKTMVHATKTEEYLTGKQLGDPATLKGAIDMLVSELIPDADPVFGSAAYKKQLALSLFYKYVLTVCADKVDLTYASGAQNLVRPVSSGQQSYDTQKQEWPLTEPLPKLEANVQVTGEAQYINDIPVIPGQLYAAFVLTTMGNAKIGTIDPSAALKVPGVVKFLTASDIPSGGVNNCMPFGEPEEVFCSGQVEYAGQALGLIVAESQVIAERAARMVTVTYTDVQTPIVTMADAIQKKSFFPKQADDVIVGNAEQAIADSPKSVTGSVMMSSQYHFHMETQISQCVPTEDGMKIAAGTQFPDGSQTAASMILGEPVNSFDLEVRRVGGAFGGKILKNFHVTAACALASRLTNRPVRLMESLSINMSMVGKRPGWQANYQVGFTEDGKLNGVKVTYYCDSGYSPNIASTVQTAMTFGDNVYHCDNWHMIPIAVKTNCPGHTAVRGPGAAPGIFMMETIMEHVAKSLDKDPTEIKTLNLYTKGQVTPTKMPLTYCSIGDLMTSLETSADVTTRQQDVQQFNKENRWKKRGLSVVPLKYGIQWAGGLFNSFVSIYNGDATVAINHGGVELGQGINTKVAQVCAYELGIPMDLIQIKPTNTLSAANTGVTGGSVGSELTCKAITQCCQTLVARMAPVKAKMVDPTWKQLVQKCFAEGIDLCARLWLFPTTEYEFQYNSYGVTCTEVELDVLTGEYLITRVDLLYDCGESMNPVLDIGQVEGAFVFGLGLYLLEETLYDPQTGENITNSTWNYKPPSSKDIPVDFRIQLLKNAPNPLGVLKSKAVGEPPLCMSSSALFALKHAVESARKDVGNDTYYAQNTPATVEKIQQNCLVDPSQLTYAPTAKSGFSRSLFDH